MPAFDHTTTGEEVVKAYVDKIPGKIFVITGPSKDTIGGITAIDLAAGKPAMLILVGRNLAKIQPVIDQIQGDHPKVVAKFVQCDLADNASVRAAAGTIEGLTDKIDGIINTAGVMAVEKYTESKDGIELQLAANHTGHFLLTNLLMPLFLSAAAASGDSPARIINVTSQGYLCGGVRFDDPNFSAGTLYNPWLAYSQSKTANILFTYALASKLKAKNVLAFSVSPGLVLESQLQANISEEAFKEGIKVATEALGRMGREMPVSSLRPKSLKAGDATSIWAALAPELEGHNGAFLNDVAVVPEEEMFEHVVGEEKPGMLWGLSERLVGQEFDY